LHSSQFAASIVGAGITVSLQKEWVFDALPSPVVFYGSAHRDL
jgi:hypothetical protein